MHDEKRSMICPAVLTQITDMTERNIYTEFACSAWRTTVMKSDDVISYN